jgi:hypothetical protein
LTREDALAILADHGISGPQVYLLDVIPLVAMMWADGTAQAGESDLLETFMRTHIDNINDLAQTTVLTHEHGEAFLEAFREARPDPAVLAVLEAMIPPVRLGSSDVSGSDRGRRAILDWCLDIGAACVADYPYGDHERFDHREKECFFAIMSRLRPPTGN